MKSRWYPGYSVAAVSTVALVLTAPGQTMLLSLLNVPLRDAFDIDPFTLNTAYTVATVAASLPLVWIGKLTDRLGPRKMMLAVALSFGAACGFVALIAHPLMVFAAFFLLRFLGQGSLSLVSSHALAMWFDRRLGLISGIRSVVLFAAWVPLPAVTLALLRAYDWRATWAIFGVVVAVLVSALAWLFLRDRPEDLGFNLDGAGEEEQTATNEPEFSLQNAWRTRAYWILAAGIALPPMIGTAILFDIQPLLGARGMGVDTAARAVSAWSAAMAILAIPSGRLVDRVRPRGLVATGCAAIAASCVMFSVLQTAPWAMVAMVLHALGQSLVGAAVGATAARFFGRRHHGAIRSSLTRIGVIGTGLGPLAFGVSHRLTGGYQAALIGFGALCIPAAVASLWLTQPQLARK